MASELPPPADLSPASGRPNRGAVLMGATVVMGCLGVACWFLLKADFRHREEKQAQSILRRLGAAQLAYEDSNLYKEYGHFRNLQQTGYIKPGYTRGTLVQGYSLAVFATENPRCHHCMNSFIIVALPRPSKRMCRTFAISDDQTLRVAGLGAQVNPQIGEPLHYVPVEDPWNWAPFDARAPKSKLQLILEDIRVRLAPVFPLQPARTTIETHEPIP